MPRVVLFDPVVHGPAGTMRHGGAEGLAHRTGVGVMAIGGRLLRRLAHCLERTGKEALGRLHVACLAEHGLHEVALRVDRSIEVAPPPLHLDIGAG